tara:strand:+ start:89244 stop:89510 length:267 start_codon:yes stop_codon:yes gene_type:complete
VLQNFFAHHASTQQIDLVEFTTSMPTSVTDVSAFELTENSGLVIAPLDTFNNFTVARPAWKASPTSNLYGQGQLGKRTQGLPYGSANL